MVEQYPHTISVTWEAQPSQGASGDYTAGASSSFESDCRAEVNSTARRITGADGQLIDYQFDVYMPLTTVEVPVDADYLLNNTVSGKVKRANNGQLNSRLWL